MKPLLLIGTIVILFSIIGCERNQSVKRIGLIQIENYSLPDSAYINETISASFKASAGNGCWDDLYIDFKKTANYEYSIRAFGTFSCFENGCACPQVMVYHDTIIDFQLNNRGFYIFRIQNNRVNIITDTLVVE